jgi:hypothetical protein
MLRIRIISALAFLFLASTTIVAQERKLNDCPQVKIDEKGLLKKYIQYLSSDELQGRYPGTKGEKLAAEFIAGEFEAAGIKTAANQNSYYQDFVIYDGVDFLKNNSLKIKKKLDMGEAGYYPVKFSDNGKYKGKCINIGYGISAPELGHNDYEGIDFAGKAVAFDVSSPDGIHPHSKFLKHHSIGKRIFKAKEAGATAVFLIDPSGSGAPSQNFKRIKNLGIPVVFVSDEDAAKRLQKNTKVKLEVEMEEIVINAANVVGFLDKGHEYTVVIGAHYDHLGMGGDGSLNRGEPAIHNGADDNASGVAGLIAIARALSRYPEFDGLGSRNYLFVAFSGEEKGLLGSNFFVKSELMEQYNIDYMLNMDMIGHLSQEDGVLIVNGTGTSPRFREIIRESPCVDLRINPTTGGIGPSDHTSFYNMQIPALHFFTGAHEHYHRPTDDEEIINYNGLDKVLNYILYVIQASNGEKEQQFTPTAEANRSKAPKFSVTLGVVPDYAFTDEGMRIDGVSENKPAAIAGLMKGDIVKSMGEIKVVDMMSYMEALSEFKKGDVTEVLVQRGEELLSFEVIF